ncbi:Disease resistance protein RPS2 [Apostasia shenzhenica]|uniref:Disease resistance protein RPS2 n=1 Tax=Apostasia shenzhenica TaxID=1088818 RepID=A0A2I0AE53_9ASPA|nr:Disease resistance protein RPS2 [Apostasia shenzhenica]
MSCNPVIDLANKACGPCLGELWAEVQKEIISRMKCYLFLNSQYRNLIERQKTDLKDTAKDLRKRADARIAATNAANVHSSKVSELLMKRIPNILSAIEAAAKLHEEMAGSGLCSAGKIQQFCLLGTKVFDAQDLAKEAIDDAGKISDDDLIRPADIVAVKEQDIKVGDIPLSISKNLGRIFDFVKEDQCRVVGVYGVGGVGKSTLIKLVNNEFYRDLRGFDVVLFLSISNNAGRLQVSAIQRHIAERLGKESLLENKNLSDADRAKHLVSALLHEYPKFIVFLDDVWRKFDVQQIGIPSPRESPFHGKLILSSRLESVCRDMEAENFLFQVNRLDRDEASKLFCKQLLPAALESVTKPEVKDHVRAVIDKCEKLPLALCVIGKAAKNLKSGDEWHSFRRRMEESLSNIEDVEELMLQKLKISYDLLDPPEPLQRCLLYCALFPEDYSIKIDQLAKYWAAEGFLPSSYCRSSDDRRGETFRLCRLLEDANLLEFGGSESDVSLHDEIHRMALWIASQSHQDQQSEQVEEIFVVRAGSGEEDNEGDVEYFNKNATRISLMRSCIEEELLPDSPPDCPILSTLLLQDNHQLVKLPIEFFHGMPALKVLDISNTRIRELPLADGDLACLQYLNLRGTGITRLPIQLRFLKELRHLDLSMTYSLVSIPAGIFLDLSHLEVLDLYNSHYGKWRSREEDDAGDGEAAVNELTRLTKLQELAVMVQSMRVAEEITESRILKKSIRSLTIEYGEGEDEFIYISDFWPLLNLEELAVHSCYRLSKVFLGDVKRDKNKSRQWRPPAPETTKMRVLTLAVLSNLAEIVVPPAFRTDSYLKSLRELNIEGCPKLRNLSWIQLLERLEKLKVSDCQFMEELVEEEKKEVAFKELKFIFLSELPWLENISYETEFPSLESISVQDCPNLWKLPFRPDYTAANLRQIAGDEEWWNNLQWPGENLRLTLEHFFRVL